LYQECAEAAHRTNLAICTPVSFGSARSARTYSTQSLESAHTVIMLLRLGTRGGAFGPGAPVRRTGNVRLSRCFHSWSEAKVPSSQYMARM